MIVFKLSCTQGHAFEGWFKDGRAFAAQRRARKVSCPSCGATEVTRVPAGSRISTGRARAIDEAAEASAKAQAFRAAVVELHAKVKDSCEDVGERFAEEARRIHYGESEERGIYGEATLGEARDLVEEGVPVLPLPKLPETDA
ncbi:MAG: hypothetical protein RL477_966 [Pseudomonadota bacterium]|jgi:hypothetical protein